jgi:hypothetical protein
LLSFFNVKLFVATRFYSQMLDTQNGMSFWTLPVSELTNYSENWLALQALEWIVSVQTNIVHLRIHPQAEKLRFCF